MIQLAFYKGRSRLFNRFVAWWTAGPYSHVEAVFDAPSLSGKRLCGSSSFLDGGVRLKWIALLPDHWDLLLVPALDEAAVANWFATHHGERYDLRGLLSTSCPVRQDRSRWFCNEAVGAAAGLDEAWRFNPNSFARLMERLPGSRWLSRSHIISPVQESAAQGVSSC